MTTNHKILEIDDQSRQKKDARQRLTYFANWLTANNYEWYEPDLDKYRDFLLSVQGLSAGSVAAHMGAIRSRYRALLDDERTLRYLDEVASAKSDQSGFIAESLAAIKRATLTDVGRVTFTRNLSVRRLSPNEVDNLLKQPKLETLGGLRDAMAIGLMLCTGMNEAELSALQVSDFRRQKDGTLVVRIPVGKMLQERFVPLFDGRIFTRSWVEAYVATWMDMASVHEGNLVRGIVRGGLRTTHQPVTPRAIQKMLKGYWPSVTALDLRRAYARWLYLDGVLLEDIQENLGHALVATTLEYIGPPSPSVQVSEGKCRVADYLHDALTKQNKHSTMLMNLTELE